MGNRQTTLGAIANFMNGGAWSQNEYSDEGVPVVRVTDIKNETVDLSECKYLPNASLAKYDRHLLETGDLVICTVGSHPTQPGSVVGRAAVMPPRANGALLNQNAVRIRSALPEVDQIWLGFLGRSQEFHDYIISCARGSTTNCEHPVSLRRTNRKQPAPHPHPGRNGPHPLPRVVRPLPLPRPRKSPKCLLTSRRHPPGLGAKVHSAVRDGHHRKDT